LHVAVFYTGVQICQIMGCCEYGYEHLGYIKYKEFLDLLSICCLPKKDFDIYEVNIVINSEQLPA